MLVVCILLGIRIRFFGSWFSSFVTKLIWSWIRCPKCFTAIVHSEATGLFMLGNHGQISKFCRPGPRRQIKSWTIISGSEHWLLKFSWRYEIIRRICFKFEQRMNVNVLSRTEQGGKTQQTESLRLQLTGSSSGSSLPGRTPGILLRGEPTTPVNSKPPGPPPVGEWESGCCGAVCGFFGGNTRLHSSR